MRQDNISTLCAEAIRRHQAGDLAGAESLYRQVIKLEPGSFLPLYLLGVACFHTGRAQEALGYIDAALALNLDPEALNVRGLLLSSLGQTEDALASYDRALEIDQAYSEALNNRGNALLVLGSPREALRSLDAAILIEPNRAQAWNNRAAALHRIGRLEEALLSTERSLALDANSAAAWTARGLVLHALDRPEEAVQSYDRAIICDPTSADAHWNKGVCLLLQGRFSEGWPLYEWRARQPGNRSSRVYAQPRWQGEEIRGKTIYVYSEQGLGDTIQFSRYAQLAVAAGAQVELSVQDNLVGLLRDLGAGIIVRGLNDIPKSFDVHIPLLSMPAVFKATLDNIPDATPYIIATPERTSAWAHRIGKKGMRIGISWQGRPGGTIDAGRSVSLAHFSPIASVPNVRLISLQKGYGVEQLAALPDGMKVEVLNPEADQGENAFLDTAAVIAGLDLVITSDTAIAHLAGAMRRPVWLALQHVPDWRWQREGDKTAWYPSMTLFRQPKKGDWASVFTSMKSRLSKL